MTKFSLLGVSALLALSAAACGRMADLEAPQARETERGQRPASGPSLPEPATINAPNRELPIDGGVSTPYDGPGNNPRG